MNSSDHNKENLDKLLDRLGLREHLKIKTSNQELEIVVNNFLENCVGTVNRAANTEEYDLIYDHLYQERAKN
jgi:alcohol dehydrogenase class IV